MTVSLRTKIVFAFTWDFDEVLNLLPNFSSVWKTELRFKTNSNFVSVCHVNRHRRDTSKWSEISLRTEIWLRSEISDLPHVNAALLFLQYRGKVTEDYVRALDKLNAPCKLILTLRKLKTVLPSLKVPVEKSLQSRVVYKLMCPRCQACYVGQTDRHVLKRFKEHCQPSQPFGKHIRLCGASPVFTDKKDVNILHTTTRSIPYLETLEALWIRETKPIINTKDEFRSRELTIKL